MINTLRSRKDVSIKYQREMDDGDEYDHDDYHLDDPHHHDYDA